MPGKQNRMQWATESELELGFYREAVFPEPPEAFLTWLHKRKGQIIDEWVNRLQRLSEQYTRRPRQELVQTVTGALEANLAVLSTGNLDRIEQFIWFITKKRLEAGFPLSDVQMAFELFRFIVIRMMRLEGEIELLADSIEAINACLSHTIPRFSDHFQTMYHRTILEYSQNLEKEISLRTAELAESERRYKTLVEEINDGYFVIKDETIVFANQCFCGMHGTTLDDVVGKPFLEFVSPDCRDRVMKSYKKSLDRGIAPGQLEYTRLGCSKESAATEIKSRVVDLGQGPVTIGICRDISGRVAMEEKVREHERMAYVGHLTASLSHEIRNPLSSVKMNLQILARRLDLDGFDRRRLEITVHEVSRLEGILRQLLDAARPLSISLSSVNLADLARGCVDLLEPEASRQKVEVIQSHPGNLPLGQLDAGRVEQAVINLLLNALEASSEGSAIKVWTKATGRNRERFLELGVRDYGPGIDPSIKPHLFTPFYTSKTTGSGLGLSNVKRIVNAHAGTVEARSRRGRGATFVLRFPCRVRDESSL
jgi:PAS domain S-box-containing protein